MPAEPNDSEDPGSVTLMIHQLGSADLSQRNDAAQLVWERYFHELLALARRNLSARVRSRLDEEDVLQSVYNSVCRRQREGEFELFGRDDLWKLLVTITLCKTRNAARWHTRDKRDVRREQSLPDNAATTEPAIEVQSLRPTPEDAAVLAEAFEQRLEALPEPALKRVALRKLEGYSNREIAAELACAERSIERKLALIRRIWEQAERGGPEVE